MKIMDVDVGFGGKKRVEFLDYKNVSVKLRYFYQVNMDIIFLIIFKKKMKYTVVDGKCDRESLSESIPSFGVPEDASYETSQYIGSELPKLGVFVNEYNNIVRDKSIYLSSYAPDTGDVCVPVILTEMYVLPKLAMNLEL